MNKNSIQGYIRFTFVVILSGIYPLVTYITEGTLRNITGIGEFLTIIFVLLILPWIAITICLPFIARDIKSEKRTETIMDEDMDGFDIVLDKSAGYELPDGSGGFYPAHLSSDTSDDDILVLRNLKLKQQYLIFKGQVIDFYTSIDGVKYRATGVSLPGVTTVRGGVDRVGRIDEIITVSNAGYSLIEFTPGTNVDAVNDYKRYAARLEAVLRQYM